MLMFAYHQNGQIIGKRVPRRYYRFYSIHHCPSIFGSFQSGSQGHIIESQLGLSINQSIAVKNKGIPFFKDASPFLIFFFGRNPQWKAPWKKFFNSSVTTPQEGKAVATVHIRHKRSIDIESR